MSILKYVYILMTRLNFLKKSLTSMDIRLKRIILCLTPGTKGNK